jgi:hypothetical protein
MPRESTYKLEKKVENYLCINFKSLIKKGYEMSYRWWLMPVIPATQEADIGRIII